MGRLEVDVRKRHGLFWWLLVGWWYYPIWFILGGWVVLIYRAVKRRNADDVVVYRGPR